MSLPNVSNSLRDLLSARIDQASSRLVDQQPRAQDASPRDVAQATGTRPPVTAPTVQRAAAHPLSAQAPEGTDPNLWSVLTSDERAFFARTVTSGPLTYSRIMSANKAPAMPAIRGGRLDLRA
jgi:hypothetical protein